MVITKWRRTSINPSSEMRGNTLSNIFKKSVSVYKNKYTIKFIKQTNKRTMLQFLSINFIQAGSIADKRSMKICWYFTFNVTVRNPIGEFLLRLPSPFLFVIHFTKVKLSNVYKVCFLLTPKLFETK